MKKLLIFLMCLLLLCPLLCSCGNRERGELTEPTQGQSEKSEEITDTAASPSVTDETKVSATEPSTVPRETEKVTKATEKITEAAPKAPTAEKLKVKCIRDCSGDYETPTNAVIIRSAEELKARYGNSQDELKALCGEYTNDYFKTGVLLIAFTVEGSGSITHEVTGVDNNGGELCINIKTNTPEVGTCDMAAWQIIVEYPQGNYSGVTVNKT
ncbi:MAG: hypothetical protein K5756_01515 [Clostridiales bacterium]|nr:hypothetical protein [Clostridiales bacterium]